MLRISLSEFARTGAFGTVKAGTPRSDVLKYLGQPNVWGLPPTKYGTAEIWRYGDIEIHFFDGSVWMIFSDWFDIPRGGGAFELDPWILRAGLGCADFKEALRASNIAFALQPNRHNLDETDVITDGGVYFTFRDQDNESGPSGLCTFQTDTADA